MNHSKSSHALQPDNRFTNQSAGTFSLFQYFLFFLLEFHFLLIKGRALPSPPKSKSDKPIIPFRKRSLQQQIPIIIGRGMPPELLLFADEKYKLVLD